MVPAARHIPSCRRPLTDDAVDESQWARGGGGLLTGSQSGYVGFDSKSSPRSSSFSSSSSTVPPVGQRRYRHFLSLGSFDTQISSPQLSPRGERRGPAVFNDVHEFGSDLGTQLPVLDDMCGVGLQLKQLSQGDERPLCVVHALKPGGAAAESQRIKVGDALLSVDGCGMGMFSSLDQVARAMVGLEGTHVVLQLHRALTNSRYTVTLVRRG